jgi:hypothetical protein
MSGKLKSHLESENKQLRFLVSLISCPSPVRGWLPTPIPADQRPAIDAWLRDEFNCDHHEQGYFSGVRFCVVDVANLFRCEFPVPLPAGTRLMVEFEHTDENGTFAHGAWYATEFDWKLRLL